MTEKILCDTCGQPATMMTRDVLRLEPWGEMYAVFHPFGLVKFGCDEHPVESEEYATQLPPDKRPT